MKFRIVDAGHREAALDDVGMLEEAVRGVYAPKDAPSLRSQCLRLAIVPDEGTTSSRR